MHEREGPRAELGQAVDDRGRGRRETGVPEQVLGRRHAGSRMSSSVPAGGSISQVREEVATQQRAGRLLVEQARLPPGGHVRRVDVAHTLARAHWSRLLPVAPAAEAAGRRSRPPTPCTPQCPNSHLRPGEGPRPGVTFRAPHSSDSTWPKLIHRRRWSGSTDRIAPRGRVGSIEAVPGVEQQRFLIVDQELVEGEPVGTDGGVEGGEPGRCRGRSHRPWWSSCTSLFAAPGRSAGLEELGQAPGMEKSRLGWAGGMLRPRAGASR